MLKKIIGENTRRLRKHKGLSQKEAAARAGFTPSYWGYLERGQKNPSVEVIDRIAQSLGVEAHLLFVKSYEQHLPGELMQLMYILNAMGEKHAGFILTVLKAYIKAHK